MIELCHVWWLWREALPLFLSVALKGKWSILAPEAAWPYLTLRLYIPVSPSPPPPSSFCRVCFGHWSSWRSLCSAPWSLVFTEHVDACCVELRLALHGAQTDTASLTFSFLLPFDLLCRMQIEWPGSLLWLAYFCPPFFPFNILYWFACFVARMFLELNFLKLHSTWK